MNIDDEDKLLFFKYTLPCLLPGQPVRLTGGELMREVSESRIKGFILQVSEGKVPDIDISKTFRTAYPLCEMIATTMGKSSIDAEVIREYFLLEHNAMIPARIAEGEKFDSVACKTYAGRILSINGNRAVLDTDAKKKDYDVSLLKDARVGDRVATHFDYVSDKISAEMEMKMRGKSGANRRLKIGV